ncbi:divergent polysaccharide deacetylase family protein [Thermodesulfobacteriota bacterium]
MKKKGTNLTAKAWTLWVVLLCVLSAVLSVLLIHRGCSSVTDDDVKIESVEEEPISAREASRSDRIAIIIDDLGQNLEPAERLLEIGEPITFSVIPFLPHSQQIVELACERGYEAMLHLPMEPRDYPKARPGPDALLLSMSDEEIRRKIDEALETVYGVTGMNNHMGSRFTEDEERMHQVLKILKKKRLFFLDSLTTPKSVGYRIARDIGLPAARRDVFIDHFKEPAEIRKSLDSLVILAQKRGRAIGIGHPYEDTIRVLSEEIGEMANMGFEFVVVSELLKH